MKKNKKIAILTSGGDASGMNKYLTKLVELSLENNFEIYCIENGYEGLYHNKIHLADFNYIKAFENQAGSCIFSSRFQSFKEFDVLNKAKEHLDQLKIDTLIVLGGNGTLNGAIKLVHLGVNVIAIPCTIDNDISYSEYAIGFDSALNAAVNTINQINESIKTHQQILFAEIMGNQCPDLTIATSLAVNANYTLTIYNKKTNDEILAIVEKLLINHKSLLVIVSELLYNEDELKTLCKYIEEKTKIRTKQHIIGFVQRGATLSAYDSLIATSLAIYTMNKIKENCNNIAIGIKDRKIIDQPILKIKKLDENKNEESVKILNNMNGN